MKKRLGRTFLAIIATITTLSFGAFAEQLRYPPEVLLAGDSWGSFLCLADGYPLTFKKLRVHNLIQSEDCDLTTDSGIEARQWPGSSADKEVLKKIRDKYSAVKFIHLSLGGNDLISVWTKFLSTTQENDVFERNFQFLNQIVQSYLNANSKLKVIVSGYDFPRFTPNHKVSKYRKILEKMGSPSPEELNSALIRYHAYIDNRFRAHPDYQRRVFTIHHLGLGHFYAGIDDAGVPARTTLHPDFISSMGAPDTAGGDARYMSNKKWMAHWIGGLYDAFHLSDEGYQRIAEHIYKNIMQHQ